MVVQPVSIKDMTYLIARSHRFISLRVPKLDAVALSFLNKEKLDLSQDSEESTTIFYLGFKELLRTQIQTERDISIVVDNDMDVIGDRVRDVLDEKVHCLEELRLLSRTEYKQLPQSAQQRLGGMLPSHVNLLIRITLRHPTKNVPTSMANDIRNVIYLSLNQGHNSLAKSFYIEK